jgi:hypothetical protein
MPSVVMPRKRERSEIDMAEVLAQQSVIYVNLPESSERVALLTRLVASLNRHPVAPV